MTGLGTLVTAYFTDYLADQRNLQPTTVRSYRDALKLFLRHAAAACRRPVAQLRCEDLTARRVLDFLRAVEAERGCGIATRNQRLAALRSFFRYWASREPAALAEAQRVEAIPVKRSAPPETGYLDRDQVQALFQALPPASSGPLALRDRALLLFLYNSGARVQETAALRIADLHLETPARARLHGKGDKWRACPLWDETIHLLEPLCAPRRATPQAPVFVSRHGRALTRSGIYKIVQRHARSLPTQAAGAAGGRVSPHTFRHTTAVHLLESGVEVNVIRAWLGHVSLETTYRYAEITLRTKAAAVEACLPPVGPAAEASGRNWHEDGDLLTWLESL